MKFTVSFIFLFLLIFFAVPLLQADTVVVNNLLALQAAVSACSVIRPPGGRVIIIQPGTYSQTDEVNVTMTPGTADTIDRLTITGSTGNYNDTVLQGMGIDNTNQNFNFWVHDAPNVTIMNMTLKNTYYSAIQIELNSQNFEALNVKMLDNGECGFKIASSTGILDPVTQPNYPDFGLVENCWIGFSSTGHRTVVEGFDNVAAQGWVVAHNTFVNVQGPPGQGVVGYGCFDKGGSINCTIDSNLFLDCDIGASFGGAARVRNFSATGPILWRT